MSVGSVIYSSSGFIILGAEPPGVVGIHCGVPSARRPVIQHIIPVMKTSDPASLNVHFPDLVSNKRLYS